jgi:hypothetical protein
MRPRDLIAALVGASAVLVVAGSVAWAGIPGTSGVIQGCYDSGGNVKVVEALPCPRNYTPFQWNQQGQPGTNGTNGTNGVSPQVTPLPEGDANCPAGGAALTDASGTTAYICSGADGLPGEPGQQGERGLQGPPGTSGLANQHCSQTSSLSGQHYVWGFDGFGNLICISDKNYS